MDIWKEAKRLVKEMEENSGPGPAGWTRVSATVVRRKGATTTKLEIENHKPLTDQEE